MNTKDIKQGGIILIDSQPCSILAKVLYVSSTTNKKYYKISLSNNYIIGFDFDSEIIQYCGNLITNLDNSFESLSEKEEIIFNGIIYKKDGDKEYQRVVNIEFGELKDAEGECYFYNYVADNSSWLSPAIISETNQRADFFGNDLSKYEINLLH